MEITSLSNNGSISTQSGANVSSIKSQIQMLELQISQLEQGTLEDESKEKQIEILESRIANLEVRLENAGTTESSSVSISLSEKDGELVNESYPNYAENDPEVSSAYLWYA